MEAGLKTTTKPTTDQEPTTTGTDRTRWGAGAKVTTGTAATTTTGTEATTTGPEATTTMGTEATTTGTDHTMWGAAGSEARIRDCDVTTSK